MIICKISTCIRSTAIVAFAATVGVAADAAILEQEATRFTSSRAGSFSETVSVSAPNLSIGWTGTTDGGNAIWTSNVFGVFEKFDSSLGTLTGATLVWESSVILSRSWTNITCNDGGLRDESCEKVDLTTGGSSSSVSIQIASDLMESGRTNTTTVASFSLAATGIGRLEPGADETNLGTVKIDSVSSGLRSGSISGFNLAALTGSGDPYDFFRIGTRSVISYGTSEINCDASLAAPRDTCSADLLLTLAARTQSVKMVYTYTPPPPPAVPLPASGFLLIGGLAALGLRRRR